MNKHRAWQYGLLVLALLLSSPVSQAVPIPVAFSLTLERLPPGSRDGNDPDREILGSGSFRLDVEFADSAIRQFQDDYEFCLFHGSDPEHEGFCSMIGDQIWVDVPVSSVNLRCSATHLQPRTFNGTITTVRFMSSHIRCTSRLAAHGGARIRDFARSLRIRS
jgi:hypothetical protein